MTAIMKKNYDIPSFARHLASFANAERGSVLKKSGVKRRFRYRFTDPLMQPFVIMKGLGGWEDKSIRARQRGEEFKIGRGLCR